MRETGPDKMPLINRILVDVDSEIEDLYCPLEGEPITEDKRIIKPEYDLIYEAGEVPRLEDLAMSAFGDIFNTYWFQAIFIPAQVWTRLGHYIPVDADILKAALVIDETNSYWKRRTENRWPYEAHNIFYIKNNWKNYFIERYFGEYLETLDPNSVDYLEEQKVAEILSHYIQKLRIDGLNLDHSDDTQFCFGAFNQPKSFKGIPDTLKEEYDLKKYIFKQEKKEIQLNYKKIPKHYLDRIKRKKLYYKCLKRKKKIKQIIRCKFCRIPFKFGSRRDIKKGEVGKLWNVTLPCRCRCRCVRNVSSRLHLATFIGALYRLRSLSISYGFINYDLTNTSVYADVNYQEFYCFTMSLTDLLKFRHLKISLTNLDPLHMKILYLGCCNMRYLEILEITNCTLNDSSIRYIVRYLTASIYKCRLKVLNLSGNLFTGTAATLLCDALIKEPMPLIKHLDLSDNPLTSIGANAISRVIIYNRTIETINLCKTGMDTTGIIDISMAIFNNSFLKNLDTSCNSFSKFAEEHILDALNNNSVLEKWDLRECGLQDTFLKIVKDNLLRKNLTRYREEARQQYEEAGYRGKQISHLQELRIPPYAVRNRPVKKFFNNIYATPDDSSVPTDLDYELTSDAGDLSSEACAPSRTLEAVDDNDTETVRSTSAESSVYTTVSISTLSYTYSSSKNPSSKTSSSSAILTSSITSKASDAVQYEQSDEDEVSKFKTIDVNKILEDQSLSAAELQKYIKRQENRQTSSSSSSDTLKDLDVDYIFNEVDYNYDSENDESISDSMKIIQDGCFPVVYSSDEYSLDSTVDDDLLSVEKMGIEEDEQNLKEEEHEDEGNESAKVENQVEEDELLIEPETLDLEEQSSDVFSCFSSSFTSPSKSSSLSTSSGEHIICDELCTAAVF